MARIGILTCSSVILDLECSAVACLADLRKRKGTFSEYPKDEELNLVGIINCPGCPTLTGTDKLLKRIRALTEFHVDSIHLAYCVKALCPFREKYRNALEKAFPDIKIVIGTHEEHLTIEEFREKVRKLFGQPSKSIVDVILRKD